MERVEKKFKKSIALIIVFAMVAHYFLPLGEVLADEPQNNNKGSYVLTFTFNANNQRSHTMVNDNGHLKIDGQYVDLRDASDNQTTIGTVACNDTNTNCTITVSDGKAGKLSYYSANNFTIFVSGHEVSFEQIITNNEAYSVQDYVAPQQQGGEGQGEDPNQQQPGQVQFDGKAYLVWSCGTGVCYHYFDNIPNFNDGNSTFYKDTEITADNKAGVTFSINAQYKGWYLKEEFTKWQTLYAKAQGEAINWDTLDPKLILGDPKDGRYLEELEQSATTCVKPAEDAPGNEKSAYEDCIHTYAAEVKHEIWTHKLQPVGEPEYKNAYVSYGDRNFKVVIINSDYKGVSIGSLEDLTYYPAEWTNAFIKRDQFDISGTSKDKPTGITTILLEKIVTIKEINQNGFRITSIKALDVPEDAVEIRRDVEKNEWKLTFSSNFFDNVVFEATDSNGGKTYFQVKRTTIDGWINHTDNKAYLQADFYFDRTKSYSDFELTATIEFKDGTEKQVKLDAFKGIDDGLGNIADVYEVDEQNPVFGPAGKGLKKSTFRSELTDDEERNIKKVYLNAEYKGSTAGVYAGNYAGSGKGVLANIYVPEGEE